ncbi:MAG: 50S ribosomal protein L17, partial [Candidatus Omnitrophica bacterium]|nr:50S ribosomal protein L17 [Candidatus Omnitrophota bacterium]
MRHQKSRYQLNRFTSWRKATLVSLAKNLLIHQSIKTTKVKAKAARRLVERLISLGKENTLSAKRRAYQILGEHRLVSLLFNEIASRFGNRNGGYTRILPLGRRRGDNASLVIFELTEKKVKKIV